MREVDQRREQICPCSKESTNNGATTENNETRRLAKPVSIADQMDKLAQEMKRDTFNRPEAEVATNSCIAFISELLQSKVDVKRLEKAEAKIREKQEKRVNAPEAVAAQYDVTPTVSQAINKKDGAQCYDATTATGGWSTLVKTERKEKWRRQHT